MLRRADRSSTFHRASAFALIACSALVLPGCELVLGMSGHDAVLLDSGADGTTGDTLADTTNDTSASDTADTSPADTGVDVADVFEAEAPATPCVLPVTGDSNARFSNMTPSADRVDLCLVPTAGGTAIGPIFGTSGSECPIGIGYKDSTASFAVKSGSYNAVFIKAGGSCSDTPVATATNVSVAKGAPVNIVLTGDGATPPSARSFVESVPDGLHFDFRFIHAVANGPSYDFGITGASTLPTTLSSIVGTNVAFGQTLPAGVVSGIGTTDVNGYISEQGSLQFGFGVAKTGTAPVLAI
ncbi:MAG: hypothetical protein ACHREM_29245, partial [Polyangiales bacterium]